MIVTQLSGGFPGITRSCVVEQEFCYTECATGGLQMDTGTLLLIGAGFVPGVFLGRWWAERRRALFDMNQVWNGRRRYRR